jgi:hypothetical protein
VYIAVLAALGPEAAATPKRELPDYDGRGNPDADHDAWALWIPRALLSPLYVANEYVLRRPLGAFVRTAERDHWADTVAGLFEFGPDNRDLIVPTALFDFGLLPSVGVYFSGDDMFASGNDVRLHAATWGAPWIHVTAADRYRLDSSQRLEARFELKRSEDNLFFGLGPDVTSATQSRYGLERADGKVGYRRRLTNESRIDVSAGVRQVAFVEGQCCGDPSIETRLRAGELMAPPGYGVAYTSTYGAVDLRLDSRPPEPEPATGWFAFARGRPTLELGANLSWIEYGGAVGGSLDLTGHQRTLKLLLAADLVDAVSPGTIPFTEYPVLGSELMPGFVTGWMVGRSTVAAQLGYTWPVWLGLAGQTRLSIGNAFGEHFAGFAAKDLRMSGDIGFTTSAMRDQGFELLFGLGTETFGQGGGVTSVRVTFGSRQGF